jgi:hypothetical protein
VGERAEWVVGKVSREAYRSSVESECKHPQVRLFAERSCFRTRVWFLQLVSREAS